MLWKQPNKYKNFFTLVVIYALICWLLYQIDEAYFPFHDPEVAQAQGIVVFINAVAFTAMMYGWISSGVYLFGILIINAWGIGWINSLY